MGALALDAECRFVLSQAQRLAICLSVSTSDLLASPALPATGGPERCCSMDARYRCWVCH